MQVLSFRRPKTQGKSHSGLDELANLEHKILDPFNQNLRISLNLKAKNWVCLPIPSMGTNMYKIKFARYQLRTTGYSGRSISLIPSFNSESAIVYLPSLPKMIPILTKFLSRLETA